MQVSDVVILPDGRDALVTTRGEAEPEPLAALLELVVSSERPRRARRAS
jgi:hypothetical protein